MILVNKPSYKGPRIGSTSALAEVLGMEFEDELLRLAADVRSYYRPGKTIRKPNGELRKTVKTVGTLRRIQGRIKGRILSKVNFPSYLQGGVKDYTSPRDHISNAAVHAGCSFLIAQDVRKFYPSVTPKQIRRIWQCFFNFPPTVAATLTDLTINKTQLPQGTVTSNYLANLMFFDVEPHLVAEFEGAGIIYTRYIDDISLSSVDVVSNRRATDAIRSVIGMMSRWGFRPKREKHQISSSGRRMSVHGLVINRQSPTVPQEIRSSLRREVFKLEELSETARSSEDFSARYKSLSGKLSNFGRLHPREAAILRERLRRIRPIPSDSAIGQLRRQVRALVRTRLEHRSSQGFVRRMNQVSAAIGEVRHARPNEANQLQQRIAMIRRSLDISP